MEIVIWNRLIQSLYVLVAAHGRTLAPSSLGHVGPPTANSLRITYESPSCLRSADVP